MAVSVGRIFVEIGGDLKGLTTALGKASRKLTAVGSQLTGALTVPLAAIGGLATRAFASFDDALTQSVAISEDFASSQGELARVARDVALQSKFSATEAAEAYFYLASAGLSAQQSIAALPAVTKFATAGNFDLARATDLVTDAQSALGLSVADAVANLAGMERVSDVLVKANTLANASVEQFSEALTTKAGAALRGLGKDVEEGVAVLAAFADQGTKGSEAGTQLSIVLRDLQTKAIQNKDAFREAGIQVFDAHGEFRNMADVLADLERALEGTSDETRKATLLQLGFSDKSVAALQALIGLSEKVRQYERDLREAGGTTEKVAGQQLQSLGSQFLLLRNAVGDVAITIGEALAPTIEKMIALARGALEGLGKVAKAFSGLDQTTKDVIVTVAALVTAIGPLLLAGGLAIKMVLALKSAVLVLGGAIGFLAANPMVLLAGALAAVVIGMSLYSGATSKAGVETEVFTTRLEEAESAVAKADAAFRQVFKDRQELQRAKQLMADFRRQLELLQAAGQTAIPAETARQARELQKAIDALTVSSSAATEALRRRELEEAKIAETEARLSQATLASANMYALNRDELERVTATLGAYERQTRELIEAGIEPENEVLQRNRAIIEDLRGKRDSLTEASARATKAAKDLADALKGVNEEAAKGTGFDAVLNMEAAMIRANAMARAGADAQDVLRIRYDATRTALDQYVEGLTAAELANLQSDETYKSLQTQLAIYGAGLDLNAQKWALWAAEQERYLTDAGTRTKLFSELTFEAFNQMTTGIGQAMGRWVVYSEDFGEAVVSSFKALAAGVVSQLTKLLLELALFYLTKQAMRKKDNLQEALANAGETFGSVYASVTEALPWPFNVILAPILAAIAWAAVMASAVAFAAGGLALGPTLGLVGEAGPELILPLDRAPEILGRFMDTRDQVMPRASAMASRARAQPLILQVDGRTLGRVMLERMFGFGGEADVILGNQV